MRASSKLSHKQERLIAALLACDDLTTAATRAGVAASTMYRWLQEQSFQQAYREARREVVQHAIVQLQKATSTAVQTLITIMEAVDASASSRVAAARAVLDMSLRAIEIEDLEHRIGALEAAQKGTR